MNMNEHLKAKYTTDRPMYSMPYKTRTGNSHGVTRDKMPAHVPCKRAPAGAKVFVVTIGTETLAPGAKQNHRKRVMVLQAGTGKRRMFDLADIA